METKGSVLIVLLVAIVTLTLPAIPGTGTFASAQTAETSVSFTSIQGNGTVAILNQTYLSSINSSYIESTLSGIFARHTSYMAIIYGAQQDRGEFFKDWNSALNNNHESMPVQVVNPNSLQKVMKASSSLLNDTAVAIAFNPFGEILSGNTTVNDFSGFVSYAVTNFYHEMHVIGVSGSSPPSATKPMAPLGIAMSGSNPHYFNGIGFAGWYKIYGWYNSYKIGWIEGLWTYYEYTFTSANGTKYYEFASIGKVAIQATNSFFTPGDLWTHTGWNTTNYPGQLLYDWNPQNTGSYSNGLNITYTVTVKYGPASVSVSETVPQSIISWTDQSDPSTGNAKVDYTFNINAQSGATYTLYPGSTGFLDPYRSGGGFCQ